MLERERELCHSNVEMIDVTIACPPPPEPRFSAALEHCPSDCGAHRQKARGIDVCALETTTTLTFTRLIQPHANTQTNAVTITHHEHANTPEKEKHSADAPRPCRHILLARVNEIHLPCCSRISLSHRYTNAE